LVKLSSTGCSSEVAEAVTVWNVEGKYVGRLEELTGALEAPVVQGAQAVAGDANPAVLLDDLRPLLATFDARAHHEAIRVVEPEPAVGEGATNG
jgi:hypothetical protein